MSPWDVIGWLIAIVMFLFTALFVIALMVAVARKIVEPKKTAPKTIANNGRHLRPVD